MIPSNWDEKGNITSLKIASANEKEYIISNQDVSDMIAMYLRKEITVTGVLEQGGGSRISMFRMLPNRQIESGGKGIRMRTDGSDSKPTACGNRN